MMPEIHQRVPYNGRHADLFALGVTVFAMRMANFPWTKAVPSDDYYRYFFNQNQEVFWKIREEKQGVILSAEFKDFLNKLWGKELSVADALRHPFIVQQEDIASSGP